MEHTVLVSWTDETAGEGASDTAEIPHTTDPGAQTRAETPATRQATTDSMSVVRKSVENQGISAAAADIIMQSWRQSTKKQYVSYINRWLVFCGEKQADSIRPPVGVAIDFLTDLYGKGHSYSAINTARSALSTFLVVDHGSELPIVKRFMKGIYQARPTLPRYVHTWDPAIVLNFLRKLSPSKKLSLRDLTLKLVMLAALTTAQRLQTLQLLDISRMDKGRNGFRFEVTELVKQSKPGRRALVVELPAYPPDRRLCVKTILVVYLERTKDIREEETRLLISYTKPHRKVAKDTLARWIKTVMMRAGINTKVFGPHSTRSASTSVAARAGMPTEDILKAAGWSAELTFAKFYKKPIQKSQSFGQGVLKHSLGGST